MTAEPKLYGLAKALVLAAILLLGFGLRSLNLNFPSIGYHNLNENEYLIAAREMKRTGDYFTDKIYCRNIFQGSADRYRSQPPLISYQIVLAWKLFDENLWGPRLFNVIFGCLSVLALYLAALILFKDELRALSASLLLAIMPLAVFFSRNLQPESPAFFFMVLANLFYLRFISSARGYELFMSGLSLSIACLYSFNFGIAIVPFIFCFPFKRYIHDRNDLLRTARIFFLSLSPLIIITMLWLRHPNWQSLFLPGTARPLDICTAHYWAEHGRTIWWYANQENFTIVYILLALSGMAAAFLKRVDLVSRYVMGWALGLVLYGIVYSGHLFENNFSQMPFLMLVPVSATYAVSSGSYFLKKYFKRDLFLACVLIVVSLSIPFVSDSILRMYGTIFLGADAAGESLREFTGPGGNIFLSGHIQGYGILRYSGTSAGWTDDPDEFKDREKEFNITYACFYPVENLFRLKETNARLFEYLEKHYHIKEVGLTEEPVRLYYIILERGKGCDLEASLKSLTGIKQVKTIYKTFDNYIFFYTIRTAADTPKDA